MIIECELSHCFTAKQTDYNNLNLNMKNLSLKENCHGPDHQIKLLREMVLQNCENLKRLSHQLRNTVSKAQYLSTINTKISFSQIGKIVDNFKSQQSVDRKVSSQLLQGKQALQEGICQAEDRLQSQLARLSATLANTISKELSQLKGELRHQVKREVKQELKQQIKVDLSLYLESMILDGMTQWRETDVSLKVKLLQKADRSEFEKVVNLARLLAIQCEQVKSRFTAAQANHLRTQNQIAAVQAKIERIELAAQQTDSRNREIRSRVLEMQAQLQEASALLNPKGSKPSLSQAQQYATTIQLLTSRMEVCEQANVPHQSSISPQLSSLQATVGEMNQQMTLFESAQQRRRCDCKESQPRTKQMLDLIRNDVEASLTKSNKAISQCLSRAEFEAFKQMSIQRFSRLDEFDSKFIEKMSSVEKAANLQLSQAKSCQQKICRLGREVAGRVKVEELSLILEREIRAVTVMTQQSVQLCKAQLGEFSQEQQMINQALCSENVVVRLLWSKGELKGGNLIVWDKEIINTLPENFQYSKAEQCLVVESSGIYRVELGFYSKKKPTIQIIVNGQTIVSAVNSSSYVLHHSSGRLKDSGNSQVTGLTYIDFLSMSEHSRIAVSYIGDCPGEGFFGMQRL